LINVCLAGTETDMFTVFMFFSVGEDFVVLTCKNIVVILQSDNRWHTGTFCTKFHIAFILWISNSSLRNHSFSCSLGPLRTFCLWISLEMPHLLPFLSHTRSWRCLWCRGHTVCGFALYWNSLSAHRQKGAPFFEAFSLGKSKKLGSFWNCFCTQKWHNTSTSSVLISK